MPSGKPVDWSLYDHLIIEHLPRMMLNDFCKQFIPHISPKAIGARARKLEIKPAKRTVPPEVRAKIAASLCVETPELVDRIRSMRQTHSIRQICAELSLDDATLWRIINRHGIVLTDDGRERAHKASSVATVGREPWNKGGQLSEDTKQKIGAAVSGELNGQYGRGMTDDEKERWRITFNSGGRDRLRQIITDKIISGELKPYKHFVSGHHDSKKAGCVFYRSSYELKYFKMLDADCEVVSYEVEPFAIEYTLYGLVHSYVPDVLVYYANGTVRLVEIKPSRLVSTDKNQAKIAAAQAHCDGRQIEFAVVTEDDLS